MRLGNTDGCPPRLFAATPAALKSNFEAAFAIASRSLADRVRPFASAF